MHPGRMNTNVQAGEVLHNGIRLPADWPPKTIDSSNYEPMPVPYLREIPEVIPIDTGRQLFVDYFLIEESTLSQKFHLPEKYKGNPVFLPETEMEIHNGVNPCATPKSGGVWWDPADKAFKMWYEAGWLHRLAYATSKDGIHWERPELDVIPGTNAVLPESLQPDSTTVWIDDNANGEPRYKMLFREPNYERQEPPVRLMVSNDGIHWSDPIEGGPAGDRSTCYYDPFRKKWVFSLRGSSIHGRYRFYYERDNFLQSQPWTEKDLLPWVGGDYLDPAGDSPPSLYNLDAVAYESLTLGLFEIHKGPANPVGEKIGVPKLTDLSFAYSRDGFHWHRPDRRTAIPAVREKGSWERGYVQSCGGTCLVFEDKIWFYYIGFAGDETRLDPDWHVNGTYANGSTGITFLRRDGFASMERNIAGKLTTRPLIFQGSFLFVNVCCPDGELRIEVLGENAHPIPGFTLEDSIPVKADTTKSAVTWRGKPSLAELAGKPVRFRFHLEAGALYSFWVSTKTTGESNGFLGAGSPDYNGYRDC